MFGNMGQMMQLLKDLPKMAGQMKEIQERLAAARFSQGQVRSIDSLEEARREAEAVATARARWILPTAEPWTHVLQSQVAVT